MDLHLDGSLNMIISQSFQGRRRLLTFYPYHTSTHEQVAIISLCSIVCGMSYERSRLYFLISPSSGGRLVGIEGSRSMCIQVYKDNRRTGNPETRHFKPFLATDTNLGAAAVLLVSRSKVPADLRYF
jgi:hypothetical protein